MSSTQAPIECDIQASIESDTQTIIESDTQAPIQSKSYPKLPLKCQEWMSDLWKDLSAKAEAGDTFTNTIHTKVLGKHTGRIQRKLKEKLSVNTCTLARLAENRPGFRRPSTAYKEKATKVRTDALATISEDHTTSPRLPKMPRLPEKKKLAPWVDETIKAYGEYVASDSVDVSIKPRIKEIRQYLWLYRETRRRVGKLFVEGKHGPSRSHLECWSTEVAIMLSVTSNITKYTRFLEESLIKAYFRPRMFQIVGMLKSFHENGFRIPDIVAILGRLEVEVRDHMTAPA